MDPHANPPLVYLSAIEKENVPTLEELEQILSAAEDGLQAAARQSQVQAKTDLIQFEEPDLIILDDQIMHDEQELLMSLDPRPRFVPKAEPEDLDFDKIEKELRQAGHTSIFDQVSNQTSSISTPV
jgi:hypothetical protein